MRLGALPIVRLIRSFHSDPPCGAPAVLGQSPTIIGASSPACQCRNTTTVGPASPCTKPLNPERGWREHAFLFDKTAGQNLISRCIQNVPQSVDNVENAGFTIREPVDNLAGGVVAPRRLCYAPPRPRVYLNAPSSCEYLPPEPSDRILSRSGSIVARRFPRVPRAEPLAGESRVTRPAFPGWAEVVAQVLPPFPQQTRVPSRVIRKGRAPERKALSTDVESCVDRMGKAR
jgi:hypothetical protein